MLEFQPVGDHALQLTLSNSTRPDPETVRRVQFVKMQIERSTLPGIEECFGAYRSVLVVYDPLATSAAKLKQSLESILATPGTPAEMAWPEGAVHRFPLCVCSRCAPDQEFASSHTGLAWPDFVRRYCATSYRVWFLGFQPGFPFLGSLDTALQLPRLEEPRLKVEAGSVGIGNYQTGIYPFASPGGWRLIGRTPVVLFRFAEEPPNLLASGDTVIFDPAFDHATVHGQIPQGSGKTS